MLVKNKKLFQKILALVLAILLLSLGLNSTFASNLKNKKNEFNRNIRNLENQINSSNDDIDSVKDAINSQSKDKNFTQEELAKLRKESSDLETKINLLNSEIEIQINKIYEIEENILDVTNQINEKEIEIEKLKDKIQANIELLKKRLVVMCKLGDASKIEILLQSSDINDFLSRNTMMTAITEYDQNLIATLKNDQEKLKKLVIELNGQKKVLEINKENIVKEKEYLESQKQEQNKLLEELKVEENEKYQKLKEIESVIKEHQDKLNDKLRAKEKLALKKRELQAEVSKIEQEIIREEREAEERRKAQAEKAARERELQAKRESLKKTEDNYNNVGSSNARLAWPAGTSRITEYFGWRIHPIRGTRHFHRGLDIGGPFNTSIYAAEDGVVTFAGASGGGYGNRVDIDHGNGMVTRYAHINHGGVLVSVGQRVSRGEKIALMGTTGLSTGSHLHFEVMIGGVVQNPLNYLR